MTGNLFGDAPLPKKARAKKAALPESDGSVARLKAVFFTEHERKFQCKPLLFNHGMAGKVFKGLVAEIGEDETARLVQAFFRSTDPRVSGSQYTIRDFAFHANRVNIRRMNGAAPGHDDARMAQNIDAVSRATGRDRR